MEIVGDDHALEAASGERPGAAVLEIGRDALAARRSRQIGDARKVAVEGDDPTAPAKEQAAMAAASSRSSLPSRSSAIRSSQPPTCSSPMKICGTVVRP